MASHQFTFTVIYDKYWNFVRDQYILLDTPCDMADCIISIGSIFSKKFNDINVSVCGFIPRDECWSVNRVAVNEVNEILKYQ